MWIPRFTYNTSGETAYIKEETTPGDDWTVPDLFIYKVSDNTKPDFSLTGAWVQKDVDTAYRTKITQMNQEESIYGFIKNTIATPITSNDTNAIQKYVGQTPLSALTDPTNLNRIILKIINQNSYEPIKANVTQNTVENRIEIRVTYSLNGISKILDEYGNAMELTEENGIILADIGSVGLAKGTYFYTVIDNKGNKTKLSITPNVDSLFKVAYTTGVDNMDINATYAKTQATSTTAENTLLTNIKTANPGVSLNKAVSSSGGATAIGQKTRTSADEKWYFYEKYKANSTAKYSVSQSDTYTTMIESGTNYYGYRNYSINSTTGELTFSDMRRRKCF